jgi:hypothetical protein
MPGAGIALLLGEAGGLVDLDVDDPALAAPSLALLFPGGLPHSLGWSTARGFHVLFRYDPRLAAHPKSVVRLPGLELKIGHPAASGKALHAVIPPSRAADGAVRLWNDGKGVWPLPESVFAYLESRTRVPEAVKTGGLASLAPGETQKKSLVSRNCGCVRAPVAVRGCAIEPISPLSPSGTRTTFSSPTSPCC